MTSAPRGEIDVLVPVHTPTRPVGRLVRSVLNGTQAEVRVLVIAHDTPVAPIATALGSAVDDPRVQVLPYEDGVASPAGPLAHALSLVRSPWFTKIDSDDLLVPGALDSWLRTARRFGASAVMPRMVTERTAVNFPTPPRRPFRRVLDPVRDRLAYRTSTMGLLSAELREAAVPTAGVPTAEDVLPSLRLWFGAERVIRADDDVPYVVGEIASDRITEARLSLPAQLAFVEPLLESSLWEALSGGAAAAIVRKVLRVHVLGALALAPELYSDEVRFAVAGAVRRLRERSPVAVALLSRADAALLAALEDPKASVADIQGMARVRSRYLRPSALVPRRAFGALAPDAPLRFLTASVLARRRGGRPAL